jgi:hypothetical protein
MHVEALDLSHLCGIVIVILGRAVLAEGDDAPIAPGGQNRSASGRLGTYDLAPIPSGVRGQPLAL